MKNNQNKANRSILTKFLCHTFLCILIVFRKFPKMQNFRIMTWYFVHFGRCIIKTNVP